ncbi:MAG TPA: hypothetical protein VIY86_13660, partial [Pirellulaceae bacterium]
MGTRLKSSMSVASAGHDGAPVAHSFWRELFLTGLYKRNQGRYARCLTLAAIVIAAFLFGVR